MDEEDDWDATQNRAKEPIALYRIDRCIGIAIYTTNIQTSACPEHPSAFVDGSGGERN